MSVSIHDTAGIEGTRGQGGTGIGGEHQLCAAVHAVGQIGDDLTEGKPTLPLIHAIQNGTPDQSATVKKAIQEGGLDNIDEICRIIESTNSIAYTNQLAQREASNAIDCLNGLQESIYLDELVRLANFAVNRSF